MKDTRTFGFPAFLRRRFLCLAGAARFGFRVSGFCRFEFRAQRFDAFVTKRLARFIEEFAFLLFDVMLHVLFQHRELCIPFIVVLSGAGKLCQQVFDYLVLFIRFERYLAGLVRVFQGRIQNGFFNVCVEIEFRLELAKQLCFRLTVGGFDF